MLSVGLLILSLFRLIIYYHYFGINIVSFIDFTEALALSTPLFIVVGLILIIAVFITLARFNPERDTKPYPLAPDTSTFLKRFRHYTSPFGYFLFTKIYPASVILSIGLAIYRH